MIPAHAHFLVGSLLLLIARTDAQVIVNTWPFLDATSAAWTIVANGGTAVDAVVEVKRPKRHRNHAKIALCFDVMKLSYPVAKHEPVLVSTVQGRLLQLSAVPGTGWQCSSYAVMLDSCCRPVSRSICFQCRLSLFGQSCLWSFYQLRPREPALPLKQALNDSE